MKVYFSEFQKFPDQITYFLLIQCGMDNLNKHIDKMVNKLNEVVSVKHLDLLNIKL